MNKNDFIDTVSQRTGATVAQTRRVLEEALALIGETTALGTKVTLPGFGTFQPKDVPQRAMRNPATGEPLIKPPTRKVVFKVGSVLKAQVAGETPNRVGRG